MKLTLVAKRPETEDVTSFLFSSDAPLKWQAGQFLHYSLLHPDADDQGIARYFTIASAPFEGHIMLTTRFASQRSSSFKRALRQLHVGAAIEVSEPEGDFVVGDRSDPNNPYAAFFVFAPCHGHYHIRDFSVYELLNSDRTLVVAGHKQGFCFEDSFKYDGGKSNGYTCANQGITSGWGDWYYKQLTGQWIDITGVPEGDYIVRVSINVAPIFDEGSNRYPNVVETPIHVPNPRKKVAIDNSPELIDK